MAEFALSQPEACYAAYTFGLKHRYTYFLRTLRDIHDLLEPLEHAKSNLLIPVITDYRCSPLERDVLALPVRLGGLGITNPCREGIRDGAPRNITRALDLAGEKGSSVWLTVLPLREMGYNLDKGEFRDAIKLRYDWPIYDNPSTCVCGDRFTVHNEMICKRGGFITQRHSELKDLEAELLDMVCNDVKIEPVLQDITGEELRTGSNTAPDARLDIHANHGNHKEQHSLMSGSVTLMLTLIGT